MLTSNDLISKRNMGWPIKDALSSNGKVIFEPKAKEEAMHGLNNGTL